IASDETIHQLCVECTWNRIFAEETPLPTPTGGQRIHLVNVDKVDNCAEREYLKSVLLKPDLHTDRLEIPARSDPLEEEQDPACEDTQFALVSLKEILQKQRNFVEQDIHVFDSQDDGAVIGELKGTVEALHAL
ncbi:FTM protein, partial [Serilophus lunatus]|nr:FTM protein [Serilophus lunatus]